MICTRHAQGPASSSEDQPGVAPSMVMAHISNRGRKWVQFSIRADRHSEGKKSKMSSWSREHQHSQPTELLQPLVLGATHGCTAGLLRHGRLPSNVRMVQLKLLTYSTSSRQHTVPTTTGRTSLFFSCNGVISFSKLHSREPFFATIYEQVAKQVQWPLVPLLHPLCRFSVAFSRMWPLFSGVLGCSLNSRRTDVASLFIFRSCWSSSGFSQNQLFRLPAQQESPLLSDALFRRLCFYPERDLRLSPL